MPSIITRGSIDARHSSKRTLRGQEYSSSASISEIEGMARQIPSENLWSEIFTLFMIFKGEYETDMVNDEVVLNSNDIHMILEYT